MALHRHPSHSALLVFPVFFHLTELISVSQDVKRELLKVMDTWRTNSALSRALNHVGVARETLDREYVIPLAKMSARLQKNFYRTREVSFSPLLCWLDLSTVDVV